MQIDLLIFAAIAVFLIFRLNAVLGTRHSGERSRPNPFSPETARPGAPVTVNNPPQQPLAALPPARFDELVDKTANADGRVETGLTEIMEIDPAFNVQDFVKGARMAFEMIVKAYADGNTGALLPLLSPRLFADFRAGINAREAARHKADVTIHRIRGARIVEAHLGGAMAYVTVDFDVEETAVTRDEGGNAVEGDPDHILEVHDVWTFTRDTRARDPNWILIETRAAEK